MTPRRRSILSSARGCFVLGTIVVALVFAYMPGAGPVIALSDPTPSADATAEPTAEPTPEPSPDPTPEPTPPPPFLATDRVGAPVPVNLRAGPGTTYASLGTVPPGTALEATGEATDMGGFTWRRFRLVDGRVGWLRQADVLPLP